MKVAIVAAHGVIPQVRYGFQDQVGLALCGALNKHAEDNKLVERWTASVVFEPVDPAVTDPLDAQKPTVVRVHQTTDDADDPEKDVFDVHEAYWSPIDKGKTNAAAVGAWLLRTIFLPFNDTARHEGAPQKAAWDIGFIVGAILLGVAFFALAVLFIGWSVGAMTGALACATGTAGPQIDCARVQMLVLQPTFPFVDADYAKGLQIALNPALLIQDLRPLAVIVLLAGAVGGYLLAQAIRAAASILKNWSLLAAIPIQLLSRIAWTLAVAAIGAALVTICARSHVEYGVQLGAPAIGFVAALLAFDAGRGLALWFIAAFFGDVQIYTTRDENSAFFAIREAILDLVTRTILAVVRVPKGATPYDRVYVFAHSLGSTISMDALLRLFNLHREGGITDDEWTRIRAFVTFGTSLEKTRYFTDAWSPTLSQQYQEWRDDIYGTVFTPDPASLEGPQSVDTGIFWLNCWYFTDFVADEIRSYRSVLLPGEKLSQAATRRVDVAKRATTEAIDPGKIDAQNRPLRGKFSLVPPHVVTHGDYLGDPQFWRKTPAEGAEAIGVLDVVLSGQASRQTHAMLLQARTAYVRDERRWEPAKKKP
jgi:pimeloyl-ACP methyl ester carboxylesterase